MLRSCSGSPSDSKVGIVVLMVRSTPLTLFCCTKALTRKRPMFGGAMAKLHSLVDSNSLTCRSVISARMMIAEASPDSGLSITGVIAPSTLIAGGKPAEMNRSEPFFCFISVSSCWTSLIACSRSMPVSPSRSGSDLEVHRVRRLAACFFLVHETLLDQVLEALVERLHAVLLAGLDRRIHLRDLGLADQVPDGRVADHDLVRGRAAAAFFLQQRLRDDRAQRLRQHGADHFLFRGREHVDDAVDGL